jgi:hypothetical protein
MVALPVMKCDCIHRLFSSPTAARLVDALEDDVGEHVGTHDGQRRQNNDHAKFLGQAPTNTKGAQW